MDVHIHPLASHGQAMAGMALQEAIQLNNQAQELSNQGDHVGAEQLHRQALQIKLDAYGESDASTAVTRNALGELYLTMGRLDEAEDQLKRAIAVRTTTKGNPFDAAVSVENLAQVYEAKGDLTAALNTRLSYDSKNMVCANSNCSGQTFKKEALQRCSACKAVFYCGQNCQKQDWKSRHKRFCVARRSA